MIKLHHLAAAFFIAAFLIGMGGIWIPEDGRKEFNWTGAAAIIITGIVLITGAIILMGVFY